VTPASVKRISTSSRRVLENVTAVLAADGLTMDHVVSTTVFLKDMNEFEKMKAVYAAYFKNAPPARATVEVARLPRDVKIEISTIACVTMSNIACQKVPLPTTVLEWHSKRIALRLKSPWCSDLYDTQGVYNCRSRRYQN
jgi:hypothetical protein